MSSEGNETWAHAELWKWHGTELLLVPIMMLIGIVGNICVCYIYHFRWRCNTVTLVKRMLAVLDLGSLIFAYPAFLYVTIRPESPNFLSTCCFLGFILLISAVAGSMVLLMIAVDRYLKLCRLDRGGIGSERSKKLFAVILIVAAVINIPSFWVFGRDNIYLRYYNTRSVYCFIADDRNDTAFFIWGATMGSVFVTVTIVLVVLYSLIIRTLINLSDKHDELKRRPSVAASEETLETHKQSQTMRSTAKVFIAVTIVFFASYAPYFATLILSLTKPTVEGSMGPNLKAIYDLAKLSPLLNNVANPIIYSFDSAHFRKEVKKMVTFKAFKKGFFRRRAFSVANKSSEVSITSTIS